MSLYDRYEEMASNPNVEYIAGGNAWIAWVFDFDKNKIGIWIFHETLVANNDSPQFYYVQVLLKIQSKLHRYIVVPFILVRTSEKWSQRLLLP